MGSIAKYRDRVVLMDHGTKMAEGEPAEMIDMFKKVLVHQVDSEMSLEDIGTEELPLQGT